MSTGQKVGFGATVLAVLGLLLGAQALPAVKFIFGEFRAFVSLPLFDDVAIAVFVGAALPAWLPYILPPSWPAHQTRRVTCFLSFGIAFLTVVLTYRNLIGLQYGMFAGSGAVMVYLLGSDWYYSRNPRKAPASLQDGANGGA